MPIDLKTLTIAQAHDSLLKKEYSAVELAEAYLAEIEKRNKELNAYLEVFDDVREQAEAADRTIKNLKVSKSQNVSPLLGIPLAIKDNILIVGRRAGAASKILEGYVASYDATAIQKLKTAGAVFLGRTNMDEFAMGGSTETSAYGVTRNPVDNERVPGGSSGGSAAAVAANLALAALGSDTGGSVRQPAAFCGVVGFKPTYGAVSRSGLIAMASSLDVIGPITKTVSDAKILFDAVRGRDRLDSTSVDVQPPTANRQSLKGIIGIPRRFMEMKGIDTDVLENFNGALARLSAAGFQIRDIELPSIHSALPAYYIIMPAEVSTNLARFDGVKYGLHVSGENLLEDYERTRGEGFGSEARRRILLGTYVLSAGYADAYYYKAVAVRGSITRELGKTFASGVDFIATPTAPTPAFRLGEKTKDPLSMYVSDIFTVSANIAGIPALSLPSGFVERDADSAQAAGRVRLPVGFQLMAAPGQDFSLLATGERVEEVLH